MFEDDQTPSDDPHPASGDGALNDGFDASSLGLDQVPTAALLAAVQSRYAFNDLEQLDSRMLVKAAGDIETLSRNIELLRLQTFGEIDARGKVQLLEVNKKRDSGLGIAGWEDLPKQETQEALPLTEAQQKLVADGTVDADGTGAACGIYLYPAISSRTVSGYPSHQPPDNRQANEQCDARNQHGNRDRPGGHAAGGNALGGRTVAGRQ